MLVHGRADSDNKELVATSQDSVRADTAALAALCVTVAQVLSRRCMENDSPACDC